MSSLAISYVPGYTFAPGEIATQDKLNALGSPTINIVGTIGTASLTAGSVTTTILADGALAATATGRGKMSPGFFSADATGRAFFAAGFFGAGDLTSIDIFATGFFTADAQGRTPFAANFVEQTLINASVCPVVGSSRNLTIANNVGTPNTKVDFAADEVVLKDGNSKPYLATAVSLTADVTVNGANGLDTGALAPSTWYYLYLIYNGTTVAGLLSVSSTAPTMPAGYTFKALLGTVHTDGSSHFTAFYQQDREVWIDTVTVFTGKATAGSNAYESYSAGAGGSDVNLNTVVPPIAKRLRGVAGNMTATNQSLAVAGDANGLGAVEVVGSVTNQTMDGFTSCGAFAIPLKTPQTFYWKSTATAARNQLNVNGYSI